MAEKTDQPSLVQSPATPTLKELNSELASVEDWHSLGVNLGLQGHQLREIEKDYVRNNRRMTETLDFWLRNAKSATWEDVAQALCLMHEHVVANWIRRKYGCSSTTTESQVKTKATIPPHMGDSSVLAKKNHQKIKNKFAPLLALAHEVLQQKNIDISNFRVFLTAQYLPEEDDNDTREIDPNKFVSEVLGTMQNVGEILESLMKHRLLSYKNVDILRSIIDQYAGDEIELKTKLDEYEQELAGYFLVTKMKDYLNAEIEQSEDSELDPNFLDELSLEVKANVTEKSLAYVTELWKSLLRVVRLPAASVLLHKVKEGCIEMTWLLPCHLTKYATRRLEESTDYFRQKKILRVTIAGRCVYEELPPVQESARKEEIDSGRKGDPDDPDEGNQSSVQDYPSLSSLQLIDDELENPEDIPEHEQATRCARVICMNYSLLYGQLDPEKLLPKLRDKYLIDEEQLKVVKPWHQTFATNAFVIQMLLWYDRPSHGLLKFIDTLKTIAGQEHLGMKLEKDYKHPSPVFIHSPSVVTAVHSDLSEICELFQQMQRKVMDLLGHSPNALVRLKEVLASLVLPISEEGKVVPLVDSLAYKSSQTVRELFQLMAPYWNPLSTDLFGLIMEASGCNQAANKVAEFVEARARKGHLVLCIHQLPTLASGENDLNMADLETVHNAPLSELQSLHPAVFARLPEHTVTSTRTTVRISVEVNKALLCIADYEEITTALSGFFQMPKAALVYAGCSKAPLVLCWLASHNLVYRIKAIIGGVLLMSAHRVLAEYKVTEIAVGDWTYKFPTLREVALWEACHFGLLEHVRYLLMAGVNVNRTTFDKSFALYYASREGHCEIIELLIQAGAVVNLQNKTAETSLHAACQSGHLPVVEHLIAAKADINRQRVDGATPLYIACQNGHLPLVKSLIAARADVNTPLEDGTTALFIASQNGDLSVVEHLIAAKADVNTPKKTGSTPLFIASETGHLPVVECLTAANADVNCLNKDGGTPLFVASQNGHLLVVEYLTAAKADVNFPREDGATPLFIASHKGHLPVVQCLIAAEADVNSPMKDNRTPLLMACQEGHLPVVEHLIAAKADVNISDQDGATPLMMASNSGHPSVVQVLLQTTAEVNTMSQDGTALHGAVLGQHENIVELLLEANIDPDLPDKHFQTALLIAAAIGNVGIVRKLIHHGASVNFTNKDGATPLMIASCLGHSSVVKVLLQTGATINTISQDGTALHGAVLGQHEDNVELLLEANIDPDLPDKGFQMTALMIAAATGNVGIVRKLIHHGASVNLTNKAGQTAFDVARTEGHVNLYQELQAQ